MTVYLTKVLGYDTLSVLWLLAGVTAASLVLQPAAGYLSDTGLEPPLPSAARMRLPT